MPLLSIIVPCLDEGANLSSLVARISAAVLDAPPPTVDGVELILIDDGSRDDTPVVLEGLARARGSRRDLRTVTHERTSGIPAAWRSGLGVARGDFVCVLDADLQYEPEEIPRLWEASLRTKADLVQGARATAERPRDARFLLSRGLSALLNVAFDMSLPDNKSGFFLCRSAVLADLLSYRGRYRHWQCFVMVAAHRRGYSIHAVETPFHRRMDGRSAFGAWALGPAAGVALDLVTALDEYRVPRA
jgi:phenylacetate-CoA ligase